jgi:hypothetical protein
VKNPFTGRDTLVSRTSLVDGSVHLNSAARNSYDAMKRFEEHRKRFQEMRRSLGQVSFPNVSPGLGDTRAPVTKSLSHDTATDQRPQPSHPSSSAEPRFAGGLQTPGSNVPSPSNSPPDSLEMAVSLIDSIPIKTPPYASAFLGKIGLAFTIPLLIGVLVCFVVSSIQTLEQSDWERSPVLRALTAQIDAAERSLANARRTGNENAVTVAINRVDALKQQKMAAMPFLLKFGDPAFLVILSVASIAGVAWAVIVTAGIKRTAYAVRNATLLAEGGLLRYWVKQVPLYAVSNVVSVQTALNRLTSDGSLNFTVTLASNASHAVDFPGIAKMPALHQLCDEFNNSIVALRTAMVNEQNLIQTTQMRPAASQNPPNQTAQSGPVAGQNPPIVLHTSQETSEYAKQLPSLAPAKQFAAGVTVLVAFGLFIVSLLLMPATQNFALASIAFVIFAAAFIGYAIYTNYPRQYQPRSVATQNSPPKVEPLGPSPSVNGTSDSLEMAVSLAMSTETQRVLNSAMAAQALMAAGTPGAVRPTPSSGSTPVASKLPQLNSSGKADTEQKPTDAFPQVPSSLLLRSPDELEALAVSSYRLGKFNESSRIFRELLLIDSHRVKGLYGLGVIAFARHSDATSEEFLTRVTDEDPANANAYFYLGALAERNGHRASAKELYEKTIRINPRHKAALKAIHKP